MEYEYEYEYEYEEIQFELRSISCHIFGRFQPESDSTTKLPRFSACFRTRNTYSIASLGHYPKALTAALAGSLGKTPNVQHQN